MNDLRKIVLVVFGLLLGVFGFGQQVEWVVEPILKVDEVSDFSEGLFVIVKRGKYGFIDVNGKIVIKPIYDYASSFDERGLSFVRKGDKHFYINKEQKKIESKIYFSGLTAYPVRVNGTVKFGFVNEKEKFVIEPIYNLAGSFYDGLAFVKISEKWGYIDKTGHTTIKLKYDWADNFSEGIARVKIDGKYKFIDTKGYSVSSFLYPNAKNFSESMAAISANFKWGFINREGERVIDLKYNDVKDFSNGLAAVEKDGKWGFIDKAGNLIIDFHYEEVGNYFGGFISAKKNNRWGVFKFNYFDKSDIIRKEPPVIQWTNPHQNTTFIEVNNLIISICVKSRQDANTQYQLYVDDELKISKGFGIGSDNDGNICDFTIKHNLSLIEKGIYTIRVVVTNDYGTVEETRVIHALEEKNASPPITGKSHLVVIGINDYTTWQPLNNAQNDAATIANLLTSKYQFSRNNLTTIYNAEATKMAILNTLKQLDNRVKSNDNVLIYFSGHGIYDKDAYEGYWIPYNAPLRKSSDKFISYTEINNALCGLDCQNVYLIADNCYGANLIKGDPLEDDIKDIIEIVQYKNSRRTLLAGSGEVADGQVGEHSPFAQALIDMLTENDLPVLPATILEPHVRLKVIKSTKGSQTPEYGKSRGCSNNKNNGGDFLFIQE
jgi:hypothetical protein